MNYYSGRASQLEDILTSDDLYLNYFNAFLTLPVFPCKLKYNRFLGFFEEQNENSSIEKRHFGATEEEKEKMLLWAAEERFIYFEKSDMFRELKLGRLLIKHLELVSDGSQQNFTPENLLSSSRENSDVIDKSLSSSSENESSNTTETMDETNTLYTYSEKTAYTDNQTRFTGSTSAYSKQIDSASGDFMEEQFKQSHREHEYSKYFKIRRQSMLCENAICPRIDLNLSGDRPSPLIEQSTCDESSRNDPSLNCRRQSEPAKPSGFEAELQGSKDFRNKPSWIQMKNDRRFSEQSKLSDVLLEGSTLYDADLSDTWNKLENIFASTSNESFFNQPSDSGYMDNFFQRLQSFHEQKTICLQRLKEMLLSDRDGLQDFIAFLVPTVGIHLIDFWLDCEAINMQLANQTTTNRIKAKFELLKDLENRYALRLRPKYRRHLMAAINTLSSYLLPTTLGTANKMLAQRLGEAMFDRIQYDTLRHLRAYWLPCWLLHWESRIAQCQFLPASTKGGSALFYIPSNQSGASVYPWTQDHSSKTSSPSPVGNGSTWGYQQSEEGNRNYRMDDEELEDEMGEENEEDMAGEEDERKWIEQVRDRAVSRALMTKKGQLVDLERNRRLIKSSRKQRLQRPPPSTLASDWSHNTVNKNVIQIADAGFSRESSFVSGRNQWITNLRLAWSVPCQSDTVLGMTKIPGATWESLKKCTLDENGYSREITGATEVYDSTNSSSVYIVPLTEALGLDSTEKPMNKNSSSLQVFNENNRAHEKTKALHLTKKFRSEAKLTSDIIYSRMHTALVSDAASGGPFQSFLELRGLEQYSRALGFLQALNDFARQTQCSIANRFTRLGKAWHIINTFIVPNGRYTLDLNPETRQKLIDCLKTKRNHICSRDFEDVKHICMELLQPMWMEFWKYDTFKLARALARHTDELPPPESVDEFEAVFIDGRVVINRIPRLMPPEMKSNEQMTPEERANRIRMALERRRMMDRERRRALKAVERRQKAAAETQGKSPIGLFKIERERLTASELNNQSEEQPASRVQDRRSSQQLLTLKSFLTNKLMMNQFRGWLSVKHSSEKQQALASRWASYVQQLDFVLATTRFIAMPANRVKPELTQRRVKASEDICRTFLTENSEQTLALPAKFIKRLENEQYRPSTATFRSLRDHFVQELNPPYEQFLKALADQLGLQVAQMFTLSMEDLELLLSGSTDTQSDRKKQKFTYCVQPTAEDKEHFERMITWCAFRPLTVEVILFYQYLVDYGQNTQHPFIDQDLIFTLEVLRYQELCQGQSVRWLLKQKISCILSTFLESVFPPQLQIDIGQDVGARLVKRIRRQLNQKVPMDRKLFDEAAQIILRELLPFYAGFRRHVLQSNQPRLEPLPQSKSTVARNKEQQLVEIPWLACPLTYKHHELFQRRFEAHNRWKHCAVSVVLPSLPRNTEANIISFSIRGGASWNYSES